MPKPSATLYPSSMKDLAALGQRLKDARLRRHFSAETVSARAGINRRTLTKIEAGDPSVTIGNYFQVLTVLGLEKDISTVARDDVLGRRLQDAELPQRERAPYRRSSQAKKNVLSPEKLQAQDVSAAEVQDTPIEKKVGKRGDK